MGVETLVCGAISRELEALLVEEGILVIARICGTIDDVLNAYAAGTLGAPQYAMPGCCGQGRRRFRGRCRRRGGHP
jgi:predicted Fe-Mo cluster-binding NifX family protein